MLDINASVKNTLQIEGRAIEEILQNHDPAQVEAVIDLLLNCKGKVITSGCGTSAAAARKIAHTLCCVECPAVFMDPSDAVHGGLGLVQAGDLVILLSKGGQTSEISTLIRPCQTKGAAVVAVTENPHSALAQTSDQLLLVKTSKEPDPFNMLATASIVAVVALFDAICIALMQMNGFSKEKFALIHPRGAVGNRLMGHEQ